MGDMSNFLRKVVFLTLMSILLLAGCSINKEQSDIKPVAEIRPGILHGYLPIEALPNSLAILPPPPAEGTTSIALVKEISNKSLTLRDTERWNLAIDDANLMFPHAAGTFSCALNAPITEQDTPHLYMLLRRSMTDAGLSTYTAKKNYMCTRPFAENKKTSCTPAQEGFLKEYGSYPSGHAAIGWHGRSS